MRRLTPTIAIALLAIMAAGFQAPSSKVQTTVYGTKTGHKYHRAGCRFLKKSKISMTLAEAKKKGLTPCSVCNPGE